jgi:hypothetical protein
MELINSNTVRLCRQGSNCCPIVEQAVDNYEIKDDFGGKVTLTKDQFVMLKDAIEHFEKKC